MIVRKIVERLPLKPTAVLKAASSCARSQICEFGRRSARTRMAQPRMTGRATSGGQPGRIRSSRREPLRQRGKGIPQFGSNELRASATDTPMLHKEAIEGGNTLQFLDPPQTTQQVVNSFIKSLDNPKFERYPKTSESWLVRIVMLIPDLLPKLMPLFVGRGNKGHKKYLQDLEKRGIIKNINGKFEINE